MASTQDDRIGGYLASAAAFVGITGLWAWIVRDDPYYDMTELLGLTLPVATVLYVTALPIIGFFAGRWRFQATGARGAGAWVAKVIARSLQFFYAHILIVLFTVAMVVDNFLGWNIDSVVEAIDNGLFDIAARFSPWLSAYLAGFSLGRVTVLSGGGGAARSIKGADDLKKSAARDPDVPGKFVGRSPLDAREAAHAPRDRYDRVTIETPDGDWPDKPVAQGNRAHPSSSAPPRFSRLR